MSGYFSKIGPQLSRLFLYDCDFLNANVDFLHDLINLEILDIQSPRNFSHIEFKNQNKLKWLELRVHKEEQPVIHHSSLDLEVLYIYINNDSESWIESSPTISRYDFGRLKAFRFYSFINEFNLDWLGKTSSSSLKLLNLARINSLKGRFTNLVNLRSLFMLEIREFEFSPRVFECLVNLKLLHLIGCRIRKLKAGLFKGLVNLEHLDLSSNKIELIEKEAFLNLSNLRLLDLSSNRLSSFDSGVFSNTYCLKDLCLEDNKFDCIQKETFHDLDKLERLNLRNCSLRSLDDEAFTSLTSLECLDLRYNRELRVSSSFSKRLEKLKQFYHDDI